MWDFVWFDRYYTWNIWKKSKPGILSLFTIFYTLQISRGLFLKADKRQFGVAGAEGLSYADPF